MAGAFEFADCDDDCVELGENVSINSVILGQSRSCRGNELSKAVKLGGSGRTAGIGNGNEELRSSNDPSTNE